MTMTKRITWRLLPVVLPLLLLLLWWIVSSSSTSPFFPPLAQSMRSFANEWLTGDGLGKHAAPSLSHFLLGFTLAIVIGLVVGIPLGLSGRVRSDLSPMVEFLRATPIAALVPVALILVGVGPGMEIALIAFGACWPILIGTQDGVRGTDQTMVEMARSYGLTPWQRLVHVRLPAASPQIFAGVRIGIAVGLQAMILANMFGGSSGLGYFVAFAQQTFNITTMWAGVILLAVIALAIIGLFVLVEHFLLAWHRGWRDAVS